MSFTLVSLNLLERNKGVDNSSLDTLQDKSYDRITSRCGYINTIMIIKASNTFSLHYQLFCSLFNQLIVLSMKCQKMLQLSKVMSSNVLFSPTIGPEDKNMNSLCSTTKAFINSSHLKSWNQGVFNIFFGHTTKIPGTIICFYYGFPTKKITSLKFLNLPFSLGEKIRV